MKNKSFNKKSQDLRREANIEMREAKKRLKRNVSSGTFWKNVFQLVAIVLFYFTASIALTFYQKDLILRLPFPLSIVIVHLVLKFCMAGICRVIWTRCTGKQRVVLAWKDYLARVAIVAIVSGLDIGLSQWSLEYVTLSLYTMTKTTSTPFILLFGLLLKLEKKHWSQIVIVLLISGGLAMFTYQSTSFSFVGFVMVLSAAFFSGIRWTFSQLIMQKSKLGLSNPIDFIFHIQPLMILSLLPIAVGVEGVQIAASQAAFRYQHFSEALHTLALVCFGGLLAFCMEVAEFLVVTFASSLTLAIIGVVKEVTILALAIFINGNEVSAINLLGMVICVVGIAAHVGRKAMQTSTEPSSSMNDFQLETNSEDDGGSGLSSNRSRSRSNYVDVNAVLLKDSSSLPLLSDHSSDDDSEDDEELFVTSSSTSRVQPKKHHHADDEFFLRENRTWTSIKDRHLEMRGLEETDGILMTKKEPPKDLLSD